MIIRYCVFFGIIFCTIGCRSQVAEIIVSSPSQHRLLKPDQAGIVKNSRNELDLVIEIDPLTQYQQMEGFGASMTDASAWLIRNVLSESKRNDLMKRLFDQADGIGLSFLRQPIGETDFSTEHYTYADVPSDGTLSKFSIQHDEKDIIPLLQEALHINPELKVMASPWTPPSWMKGSNTFSLGKLKGPEFYPIYAQYLTRFIETYQGLGIPIYAITVQNEPLFEAPYASMRMDWREQFHFIHDHLFESLSSSGFKTKILIFDHNWDLDDYVTQLVQYKDQAILGKIAGVAYHCYGGVPESMGKVHSQYPNLEIFLTECSGFENSSSGGFETDFRWVVQKLLIDSVRNWAKTIVRWNIALDHQHGPRVPETLCTNCLGLVEIDRKSGGITYLQDFYSLAHASKWVKPGAHRIDSNNLPGKAENVAFLNPDGSRVLIVFNPSSHEIHFQVKEGNKSIFYHLFPGAVATLKWSG